MIFNIEQPIFRVKRIWAEHRVIWPIRHVDNASFQIYKRVKWFECEMGKNNPHNDKTFSKLFKACADRSMPMLPRRVFDTGNGDGRNQRPIIREACAVANRDRQAHRFVRRTEMPPIIARTILQRCC